MSDKSTIEAGLRSSMLRDPGNPQAWLDLIWHVAADSRSAEALSLAEEAMQHHPRQAAIVDSRQRIAFQRLSETFSGTPFDGPEEGRRLQDAYDALMVSREAGLETPPHSACYLLMRLAAHEPLKGLADLLQLDRRLAERGETSRPHIYQLARIGRAPKDRLDFLAQRRLYGKALEAKAARAPLTTERPPRGAKVRLGFVSDDLRHTNIGAFAWPLFEHKDREHFELFVYSARAGPSDPIQGVFSQIADGYVVLPGATPREMAERIASDGMDLIIDFGDPFAWEVAAYRPAPRQASWMGYMHSTGLSAIDYIIVDPYLLPEDEELLTEQPLVLPRTFISMTEAYYEVEPQPAALVPEARNGFVTFGTLNGSYKYSEPCLDTWGRVLAAVPNSRFLVVRPEAASATFRTNMIRAFAQHDVAEERIVFKAVRGQHLTYYDQIDIALDTFPVTGGATTCDSLWMGVPVVSLVGHSMFERVSYSILSNAGLGDLAMRTIADYVRMATELAADRIRRDRLKTSLREQIRSNPVGQPEAFARDFFATIADVTARAPTRSA